MMSVYLEHGVSSYLFSQGVLIKSSMFLTGVGVVQVKLIVSVCLSTDKEMLLGTAC